MILTRNYDLDVIPGGQPLLIRVSKNDTSSTLVFSLFTGIGSLAIPVFPVEEHADADLQKRPIISDRA
ncbi:MAG: hypothetical protein IKH57_08515 [Clostridia bacterium]|nr:hypothetical protein [Clostridia bacterium]